MKRTRIPAVKAEMTPWPWTIDGMSTLEQARALMDEHGIHHLPVTDGDVLIGVLSERDLLIATAVREATGGDAVAVGVACTTNPYTIDLNMRLDSVVSAMAERRIGSALITRKGKLAGILTSSDVCRLLGHTLRDMYEPGGDEAA